MKIIKNIIVMLVFSLSLFADGPVLQTGQTTVYKYADDGNYQAGLDRSYTRDSSTNIVTDNITHIMWQDDIVAKTHTRGFTFAKIDCWNLIFGGYSDWRLPTEQELMSIADSSRVDPAINPIFQNTAPAIYWSINSHPTHTAMAWGVDFNTSSGDIQHQSFYHHVRCMRNGE